MYKLKVSEDRTVSLRIVRANLPDGVSGMTTKDDDDSYIIFLDDREPEIAQVASFLHECLHIWHKDHDSGMSTGLIEEMRHKELKDILQSMI